MLEFTELLEDLEKENIEYKSFSFRGCWTGSRDGFPEVQSTYNTVRFGTLDNFITGSPFVGNWVLVFQYRVAGSPGWPASYKAIYVKENDYLKAKEVIASRGYTPTDFDEIPAVKERKEKLVKKVREMLGSLSLEKLTKIYEITEEK